MGKTFLCSEDGIIVSQTMIYVRNTSHHFVAKNKRRRCWDVKNTQHEIYGENYTFHLLIKTSVTRVTWASLTVVNEFSLLSIFVLQVLFITRPFLSAC
jgi:hypothetical protein